MASLDILVVLALKEESQGLFEEAGIKPLYCGVGPIKAAHFLTRWIAEHRPKRIINFGTAGSRKFEQGTLVECAQFIQRVPPGFSPLSSKVLKVESITHNPPVICGSADFIESAEPVTNCDVFDMEAYAMAFVCQSMQVKFNSIKFISDHSNENTVRDWKNNLNKSAQALVACYQEINAKYKL
jgi:adenosylhomocysteine nucleosidase